MVNSIMFAFVYISIYIYMTPDALTNKITTTKWISSVAIATVASCFVIYNNTFCIVATRSCAWINALFTHTGKIAWAFFVIYTFRTTIWRPTNISGLT